MRLTFSDFEIEEWEYDKTIFPVRGKIEIPVKEEPAWAPIVQLSKETPALVGWLGVYWLFEIIYNGKTIVKFSAKERWLANLEDQIGLSERLDELIEPSFKRFAKEYEIKRKELKIQMGIPVLDKDSFVAVRQSIIEFLKSKGF